MAITHQKPRSKARLYRYKGLLIPCEVLPGWRYDKESTVQVIIDIKDAEPLRGLFMGDKMGFDRAHHIMLLRPIDDPDILIPVTVTAAYDKYVYHKWYVSNATRAPLPYVLPNNLVYDRRFPMVPFRGLDPYIHTGVHS